MISRATSQHLVPLVRATPVPGYVTAAIGIFFVRVGALLLLLSAFDLDSPSCVVAE